MRHLRGGSRRLTRRFERGLLLALPILLVLACGLAGGGRFAIERWLMQQGAAIGRGFGATLLSFTRIGNLSVLAPLTLFLAAVLGRLRGARAALGYLSALVAFRLAIDLLKRAVARPRPAIVPHLDPLASGFSFPSAHASDTTAVFLGFALALGGGGLRWAAALLAIAVGLSRIALGVHWPSDVVAGWSLGVLGATLAAAAARPAVRWLTPPAAPASGCTRRSSPPAGTR